MLSLFTKKVVSGLVSCQQPVVLGAHFSNVSAAFEENTRAPENKRKKKQEPASNLDEIDWDSLFFEKIDPNKPKPTAGRAWRANELRLKSDSDLEKLWYILVKEQNMLYSTQHALKAEQKQFPDRSRIGKVKQTMARIRTVLSERDHARRFKLMETQFQIVTDFRKHIAEMDKPQAQPAQPAKK